MCKLGASLAGEMVVGACASALGDRKQKGLCRSFLIRVTSIHHIKSIRMFEDDVT